MTKKDGIAVLIVGIFAALAFYVISAGTPEETTTVQQTAGGEGALSGVSDIFSNWFGGFGGGTTTT